MQSSLIGKVEKARRYAQEKSRASFSSFAATFEGEHDRYIIQYNQGKWTCSCNSYSRLGLCSHVMAMQRMLDGMVTDKTPVASLP
ncbi:MAG: hypothetical protein Q7T05_05005 [Dehalococcoidia bacterium]|nr:hypothetical protein [Dehalococcoidia bacterium]